MSGIFRCSVIIPVILFDLLPGLFIPSSEAVTVTTPLTPVRFSVPPVIDGALSDDAWKQAVPLEPAFITFKPRHGEPCPERTLVWMGYDNHNLYFAFRCSDSDPQHIKASFAARDKIGDDDAVVVSLDAQNTHQQTCQFVVNPHGVQRDMINFGDDTQDWVWYSAGRFIPEGYEVEIAIPLSSLRFESGSQVTMGILFARTITRESIAAVWPEIRAEQNPNTMHAPVVFHDLENPGSLEILPSITYGSGESRVSLGRWGNSFSSREAGGSIKYSRSAAFTLEATANPDFSHVESDAFQMDINRRYPVYYSEKRPFFMEGADIFELSRGGSNFSTTMHTRKILAPVVSTKLTGARGKVVYGILAAEDSGKNPYRPSDPGLGESRYTVARLKYLTGSENFLGFLYSGHTQTEIGNRVAALDGYWRSGTHTLRFTGIGTFSTDTERDKTYTGAAETLSYNYMSRPLDFETSFENYSRNFRMDTAFYNRTGYHRTWMNISPHYYPDIPRAHWIKQVSPYANGTFLHDLTTSMNDYYLNTGTDLSLSRQGSLNLNLFTARENWANRKFNRRGASMNGRIQATARFRLGGNYSYGRSIFYDAVNPFLGRSSSYGGDLEYQPLDRFRQTLSVSHSELSRLSDNHRAYSVNIINSCSTLQFTRHFFIRAILQYDSGRDRLMQDLLASFTLIPGTVTHFGYGGISQRNTWDGGKWVQDGDTPLYPMEKRFFFKTSYLYQF
jgi:hypothetical protein